MDSLAGKTLFVTGASRGIGRAIALRAARDGARVVVAARTTREGTRLPGTIAATAAEVQAAGGEALAVEVDVRDLEAVRRAVQAAAERFGGIDILVNNASAIQLAGLLDTRPKRFDLMLDVNVRGSFHCIQACLPWLLRSSNPHVLSLAPPLSADPRWFSVHAAYTTSKYAMAMLAMGVAAEYRGQGVAGTTLWPRTLIATAALDVAAPGRQRHARTPAIMADAAHWILCQPARSVTGRQFVDEQVLRDQGASDFGAYAQVPGLEPDLDLFIDA